MAVIDAAPDLTGPRRLSRLIRLASESESCRPLVDAAWRELRRPLAVVETGGGAATAAPLGDRGGRALALARRAARGDGESIPAGWLARRLEVDGATLGWLVAGAGGDGDPGAEALLDGLAGLLCAQLGRSALRRAMAVERRAAFRHRLVTDPSVRARAVHREAAVLGLRLAPCYWPSLVTWEPDGPEAGEVAGIIAAWEDEAPAASFAVRLDGAVVLAHAGAVPGDALQAEVVRSVARLATAQRRTIVGEQSAPVERLQPGVSLLRRLSRYPARGPGGPVVHVRDFALDRLFEHVDADRARSFVAGALGPLLAHDERHGGTLARTLELALEHPRRDDAARAAYMHRNTFRRRLQQALDLLDADLDDPDQRLSLQVALKLHRLRPGPNAP